MIPRLNDMSFGPMTRSTTPVMIVFTAPKRCHLCVKQKAALEQLQAEGIPVYVLDVEQPDTQDTERRIGGRGVPFTKVYAHGQLLNERKGLASAAELRDVYEQGRRLLPRAARGQAPGTVSGMLAGFGRDA